MVLIYNIGLYYIVGYFQQYVLTFCLTGLFITCSVIALAIVLIL